MTEAKGQELPVDSWQKARHSAAALTLDLPQSAPGTAVYIDADGTDHHTLILLRAFVRAAERAGYKVKLL